MYATALKEYKKKIEAKITISVRQKVLIKQLEIKFGLSVAKRKKILAQMSPIRLRNALRKTAFAKTREEVLKCLE